MLGIIAHPFLPETNPRWWSAKPHVLSHPLTHLRHCHCELHHLLAQLSSRGAPLSALGRGAGLLRVLGGGGEGLRPSSPGSPPLPIASRPDLPSHRTGRRN